MPLKFKLENVGGTSFATAFESIKLQDMLWLCMLSYPQRCDAKAGHRQRHTPSVRTYSKPMDETKWAVVTQISRNPREHDSLLCICIPRVDQHLLALGRASRELKHLWGENEAKKIPAMTIDSSMIRSGLLPR